MNRIAAVNSNTSTIWTIWSRFSEHRRRKYIEDPFFVGYNISKHDRLTTSLIRSYI